MTGSSGPPFRFRLRSVLRVARAREEESQRWLAEELVAEASARAVTAARAEAYAACLPAVDGPTAVADFTLRAHTAALRAEALRQAQADSRDAVERVAAARQQAVLRFTKRRTLEELEGRHRAEHEQDAGRAAQRALDELASTRRAGR